MVREEVRLHKVQKVPGIAPPYPKNVAACKPGSRVFHLMDVSMTAWRLKE